MAFVNTVVLACIFCVLNSGQASECSSKNTTCSEVKVMGGYRFRHGCPEGSKIFIYDSNKTVLAYFMNQFSEWSSEVLKIDNISLITKDCQLISIQCIYTENKSHAIEACMVISIIAESSSGSSEDQTKWPLISVAAAICLLLCGGFSIVFLVSKMFNNDGDHRGGGENENEQDITLESVLSGSTSALNMSIPSQHRAEDRNLCDDPGGMNSSPITDTIREVDSAVGDPKVEERETEGQPLLSDQRSDDIRVDMTGEALVDKRGFDPDCASSCPTAQVHDVESELNKEEQQQQQQ